MDKASIKVNQNDLRRITQKLAKIEATLRSEDSPIVRYMLTIADGYQLAVLSGMGKIDGGNITLRNFLSSSVSAQWKPLAYSTKRRKERKGWQLEIWAATGKTAKAVKVYNSGFRSGELSVFSGIDKGSNPEEYQKAINVEFGGGSAEGGELSNPGDKPYDKRALFTLLNVVFKQNSKVILKELSLQVKKIIYEAGWGR